MTICCPAESLKGDQKSESFASQHVPRTQRQTQQKPTQPFILQCTTHSNNNFDKERNTTAIFTAESRSREEGQGFWQQPAYKHKLKKSTVITACYPNLNLTHFSQSSISGSRLLQSTLWAAFCWLRLCNTVVWSKFYRNMSHSVGSWCTTVSFIVLPCYTHSNTPYWGQFHVEGLLENSLYSWKTEMQHPVWTHCRQKRCSAEDGGGLLLPDLDRGVEALNDIRNHGHKQGGVIERCVWPTGLYSNTRVKILANMWLMKQKNNIYTYIYRIFGL